MRTSKSISSIAYMSPSFFREKMEDLRKRGLIGMYLFVAHKGEGGDKDHIHFVLLGGQMVYNTEGLSDLFGRQMFPDGTIGSVCSIWKTTKDLNDWILYAVHHPVYLLRKCIDRDHHYTFEDIVTSSREDDRNSLIRLIMEAKQFLLDGGDKIFRALSFFLNKGYSWEEVALSGAIPVNNLMAAQSVYLMMLRNKIRKDKKLTAGMVEQVEFFKKNEVDPLSRALECDILRNS